MIIFSNSQIIMFLRSRENLTKKWEFFDSTESAKKETKAHHLLPINE
jgi:hypothetical protein